MYIMLFEEFQSSKKKKKKKKVSAETGTTDSYAPPEYVVQPQKGETGFFLVKKEFEKMKRRFTPGIHFSYADSND